MASELYMRLRSAFDAGDLWIDKFRTSLSASHMPKGFTDTPASHLLSFQGRLVNIFEIWMPYERDDDFFGRICERGSPE